MSNPKTEGKFRIQNVASGKYLGIQDDNSYWETDGASLAIREKSKGINILEDPQVWNLIKYRDNEWVLLNQYSKYVACIRDRSTDNGATAIQYHSQCLLGDSEPFQSWDFVQLSNGNYLIQNANSGKYIGPHSRGTGDNTYIIQWDDQTTESSYQEWAFEQL